MAYLAYMIGGGAPCIKKYQVRETMANAGVPVETEPVTNSYGIALCETNTFVDVLGVTLDTAALLTAQQADNVDPAAYVSVVINPDAVYAFRMSGAATAGTALTIQTNTVANANGLQLTLGLATDPYDDGFVWGYQGANAGVLRKVTAVDATNEVPIVAFPYDIAVGDTFLASSGGIASLHQYELCTELTEVDVTVAAGTTENWRCVEVRARDITEDGTTNSYYLLQVYDHFFGNCAV